MFSTISATLDTIPGAERPGAGAEAFVTRFAPSPTGRLHLGHAYSALLAHAAARAAGGRFLLRIEDIDRRRCRPEFETEILEDLAWLGLSWEDPVRRQSEHLADYAAALQSLRRRDLLYRCFLTRKELQEAAAVAPHGPEAPFRGAALDPTEESARLKRGEPYAWRLDLRRARDRLGPRFTRLEVREMELSADGLQGPIQTRLAEPERAGDVILARKDAEAAYHLAVVVDDALQGITHVIRGADLKEAVDVQRLLQALLGLPTPIYHHHRLILDEDGRRLAKRRGSTSLRSLRLAGEHPAGVRLRLSLSASI